MLSNDNKKGKFKSLTFKLLTTSYVGEIFKSIGKYLIEFTNHKLCSITFPMHTEERGLTTEYACLSSLLVCSLMIPLLLLSICNLFCAFHEYLESPKFQILNQ